MELGKKFVKSIITVNNRYYYDTLLLLIRIVLYLFVRNQIPLNYYERIHSFRLDTGNPT